MFNTQPGTGLGFKANRQMALGLGYSYVLLMFTHATILAVVKYIRATLSPQEY